MLENINLWCKLNLFRCDGCINVSYVDQPKINLQLRNKETFPLKFKIQKNPQFLTKIPAQINPTHAHTCLTMYPPCFSVPSRSDVPPKLSVASVHSEGGTATPYISPREGRFRHTRTVLKIDAKQERLARYHGDEMRRLVLFNLLIRVVQLGGGGRRYVN